MKKIDLFKIAIIVLCSIFLYLYQQKSEMGRYQMEEKFIFDTKNGKVYWLNGNGFPILMENGKGTKFKEIPIDK